MWIFWKSFQLFEYNGRSVWNEDGYELTLDSFAAPVRTILVVYMEWRLLIFLNLNTNHMNIDIAAEIIYPLSFL